jgi:ribonuclease HI
MTLETDGASKGNPGPSGAGYVLSAGGRTVARGKEHLGVTTNNVAEYRAMIMGLEKARQLDARKVVVLTDSLLILRQIQGVYRVRKDHLKLLHGRCMDLISGLDDFSITYVPSSQNRAHRLAEEAAGGW